MLGERQPVGNGHVLTDKTVLVPGVTVLRAQTPVALQHSRCARALQQAKRARFAAARTWQACKTPIDQVVDAGLNTNLWLFGEQ